MFNPTFYKLVELCDGALCEGGEGGREQITNSVSTNFDKQQVAKKDGKK